MEAGGIETRASDGKSPRALAAPPATGGAGFNRFKAFGTKLNVMAKVNLFTRAMTTGRLGRTASRRHRNLLESAPAEEFATYFSFKHLESSDGRMRLLDGDEPVLQHMTQGVTTFDKAMDELMERVYGPLGSGQERERWVLYHEEHEVLADGGKWEETKTSTERSYEGIVLRLMYHPQFADEMFPDKFPTKVEMSPENWEELIEGQPLAPGKRRERCQKMLAYKLMHASTELRQRGGKGVPSDPAAADARALKAEAEAAHGLWELAVRREHAMDFDVNGFKAVIAGMKSGHWDTVGHCAAAVWSLARAATVRDDLVNHGAIEALVSLARIAGGENPELVLPEETRVMMHDPDYQPGSESESDSELELEPVVESVKQQHSTEAAIQQSSAEPEPEPILGQKEHQEAAGQPKDDANTGKQRKQEDQPEATAEEKVKKVKFLEGEQQKPKQEPLTVAESRPRGTTPIGEEAVKTSKPHRNKLPKAMKREPITDDVCVKLFYFAVGAIGVLAVDKMARKKYMEVDPELRVLLDLAIGPDLAKQLKADADAAKAEKRSRFLEVGGADIAFVQGVRRKVQKAKEKFLEGMRRRIALKEKKFGDSDWDKEHWEQEQLAAKRAMVEAAEAEKRKEYERLNWRDTSNLWRRVGAHPKLQPMAAEAVCHMLIRDADARAAFAKSGAIARIPVMLHSPHVRVKYVASALLAVCSKDPDMLAVIVKLGIHKELFGELIDCISWTIAELNNPGVEAQQKKGLRKQLTQSKIAKYESEGKQRFFLVHVLEESCISLWGMTAAALAPDGGGIDQDKLKQLTQCITSALAVEGSIGSAPCSMAGIIATIASDPRASEMLMEDGTDEEGAISETQGALMALLRPSDDLKVEHARRDGLARTIAAAAVGLLCQHKATDADGKAIVSAADGEESRHGKFREELLEDGTMKSLLETWEAGVLGPKGKPPSGPDVPPSTELLDLECSTSGAIMMLASVPGARCTEDELRRLMSLIEDARTALGVMQGAAATWGMAGQGSHETKSALVKINAYASVARAALHAMDRYEASVQLSKTAKHLLRTCKVKERVNAETARAASAREASPLSGSAQALKLSLAAAWLLYGNYLAQQRDELNVFKLTSTSWWTVPKAQRPVLEPPDDDLSALYALIFRTMRLKGDVWEPARALAHGTAWMLTSASTELRQHLADMGMVGALVDVVRGGGEIGAEATPTHRSLATAHLQTLVAEVDFGVVPIYGLNSHVEGDVGGLQNAMDAVTKALLKMVREAAAAMHDPVAAREKARKKRIALAKKKAAAEALEREAAEAAYRVSLGGQPNVFATGAAAAQEGEDVEDTEALEAETKVIEMTPVAAWELRERGVWALAVLARLPQGRTAIQAHDGITDLLAGLVDVPVEANEDEGSEEDDEDEEDVSCSGEKPSPSPSKSSKSLRNKSTKKLLSLSPSEREAAETQEREDKAIIARHKHGMEMLSLAALLNLSTQAECQVAIAKRNGIYVLLAVLHAEGRGRDTDPRVSAGSITRADLASAILNNLRTNYRNRTSLYKAELRCKVGERLVAEREQEEETAKKALSKIAVRNSKNRRGLAPLAPAGSRMPKAAEKVGVAAVQEMGLGGKEKRRTKSLPSKVERPMSPSPFDDAPAAASAAARRPLSENVSTKFVALDALKNLENVLNGGNPPDAAAASTSGGDDLHGPLSGGSSLQALLRTPTSRIWTRLPDAPGPGQAAVSGNNRWEPPIKEYRQMAIKTGRLKGSANRLLVAPRDEKVYKELELAAHEEAVATLKTSRPHADIPVPTQEVILPPLVEALEENDEEDDQKGTPLASGMIASTPGSVMKLRKSKSMPTPATNRKQQDSFGTPRTDENRRLSKLRPSPLDLDATNVSEASLGRVLSGRKPQWTPAGSTASHNSRSDRLLSGRSVSSNFGSELSVAMFSDASDTASVTSKKGKRPKSARKKYPRPESSRYQSQRYAQAGTRTETARPRKLEPLDGSPFTPAGGRHTSFKDVPLGGTPTARTDASEALEATSTPVIAEVPTLVPQRALFSDLPSDSTPMAVLLPQGFTGNTDTHQEAALLCVRQYDPACPCARCDLIQERAIEAAAEAERLRKEAQEPIPGGLEEEEAKEREAARVVAAAAADAAAAAAAKIAEEANESAEARRKRLHEKLAAKFDYTAGADDLPFKVILGTEEHGDARDCVTFAHQGITDAPKGNTSSRLTVFEHIPGSRVYDNMFPIYSLPNGRSCHYYYPGRALVEIVAVALEAPPMTPDTCASIGFEFKNPEIHNVLSKPSLEKFPLGHKPVPELCSLPMTHTLDVKDNTVRSRETFGDLKERPFQIDVQEKKVIKVTTEIMTLPGNFCEPWMLPRSGFKSRLSESDSRDFYDGAALFKSMCDIDWRRVTSKARIGKFFTTALEGQDVEEGMAECRAVLEKYYNVILQCHRYYAQTSLKGSSFAMNFNAVAEFNTTCQLPDDKSEFATQGHLDSIFVASNVTDGLSEADTGHNEDANSFDRYEFVEYLLRVADAKYLKDGQENYFPDALERLITENIVKHASPLALEDPNTFRKEKMYCEAVDNVLRGADELPEAKWFDADNKRTYVKGNTATVLNAIYDWGVQGKQRGRYKHLMLDTWRQILLAAQLHKHGFSMRNASYVFIMSQMYVVDEMKHWQRHESLRYVDFLECICRIAEEMNLPTKQDLLEEGYVSYHDFTEQRKAEAEAALAKKGRVNVTLEESEEKKEKGLHYKLKGFLNFFFESIHLTLQGEGAGIKYSPHSLISLLRKAA